MFLKKTKNNSTELFNASGPSRVECKTHTFPNTGCWGFLTHLLVVDESDEWFAFISIVG